jgi:hypothetical protein
MQRRGWSLKQFPKCIIVLPCAILHVFVLTTRETRIINNLYRAVLLEIQGVPVATERGISLITLTPMKILQ